jgi:monofunctional biosynthetic peptidoglycan transglycosylase
MDDATRTRSLAERSGARRVMRWGRRLVWAIAGVWAALIVLDAVAPPISTLMLARWASLRRAERIYMPLERIAPSLPTAVIASEDQRFCVHHGVDWTELRSVLQAENGVSRGASTVTMQTVKNVLLWPSRSILRKILEIPLSIVADLFWGKRRTMEIYLNVAEWGEGVFGAEAAARRHFGKSAASLTPHESALLVAALPNPLARRPGRPSAALSRRAGVIQRRVAQLGGGASCLNR